jgi:integrase/recombinase XerD
MSKSSGKYYYENVLGNQNITAKTNVAWAADITTLELFRNQKAYVFLCIDIHSNLIIAHTISKQPITSQVIVRVLQQSLTRRFNIPGVKKLIIHTDRGTQFSSEAYNNFTKQYQDYFVPSMARQNTPTDNPVAERFMRTFKEHKIYNTTLEEKLSNLLAINPKFTSYRACLNEYVKSLNSKPNQKSKISPHQHDNNVSTATMLMQEPNHPKAVSARFGEDLRSGHVENYKAESEKVIGVLAELAARKAELVKNTPFDDFENNIALQIIDTRLNEIYSIIKNNPQITREYVTQAIEPVEDSLLALHHKIDTLLPKNKADSEVLPLRDPIDMNLFPLFFTNAGTQATRQKDLKQAQLRLAYTLLYHTGLRINEIRNIKEESIINAIAASQISVIHYKTKQPHIHVLSKTAVAKLKQLKPECAVIFNKYKCQYLFGQYKPMHEKALIRLINEDLKNTCEANEIPYNIKSHSFRINMIANLLKRTTVQHAAQIIGHNDIKSTMSYQRYALSKEQIQLLLEEIEKPVDK